MSALNEWRRELAAGIRTTLTFDALWEAACREAADAEHDAYVRPVREAVARLNAADPAIPPRIRVGVMALARALELGSDPTLCASLADALLDDLQECESDEPATESAEHPALEQWRRQVLEDPESREPLERAAAWELTAIECQQAGDQESAATAYRMAEVALLGEAAA